jgi:uncharacterized membrane protein
MTSDHSDDPTGQVPIQPAPEPRPAVEPPAAPPHPTPPPSPATPAPAPPSAAPSPPPSTASRRPDADRGRNASLILGLLFLIIGGWFFATTTLGLDLPDLDWGQFWPVILIVLGLAIVVRSLDRARS